MTEYTFRPSWESSVNAGFDSKGNDFEVPVHQQLDVRKAEVAATRANRNDSELLIVGPLDWRTYVYSSVVD